MIPRKVMTYKHHERLNPVYWYWYKLGQGARKRDMGRNRERLRVQRPEDSPQGAPSFGSSEYYSFLDGYFIRHGFQ
ncbi:MAG: hypothetical protein P1V97_22205 [Planctomycetota bacterium]|nr:hypothetical protein [Planctomycetota bacterium]